MKRTQFIYALAGLGVATGLVSAWLLNEKGEAQAPLFAPVSNPYTNGIYANGIIESLQNQGSDIALDPEVSARVNRILVREGEQVRAGQPLIMLDDTVQRATTDQLAAQAEAARSALAALRAQPRPETLAVAAAQADNAAAALKSASDARDKVDRSFKIDPGSISRDSLDAARNARAIAATALEVARRNYALVHAGAWHFDIENQQRQYEAAASAHDAASALLDKYVMRAPSDGIVLALTATQGSYVSPQGAYDARTQAMLPVATIGTPQNRLAVRAYVDEILLPKLPAADHLRAVMTVRGSTRRIPLSFMRIQPYVSPKISLSDQRQERVDIRVLPVIFSFERPKDMTIFPGQLVDIYIGTVR